MTTFHESPCSVIVHVHIHQLGGAIDQVHGTRDAVRFQDERFLETDTVLLCLMMILTIYFQHEQDRTALEKRSVQSAFDFVLLSKLGLLIEIKSPPFLKNKTEQKIARKK